AVASALVHVACFTGLAPASAGPLLALAVLAIFPLCGFAILLLLRVGRTYRVRGSDQLPFVTQRAPKALRLLTQGVLVYALICFAVFYFLSSGIIGLLAASAMLAWFYLEFTAVFSFSLGDPGIVRPRAGSGEPLDDK